MNPLHILSLHVQDYGIIKDANITPTDKPTVLAGVNGAGKSTMLNAIEAALNKFSVAQPIRKGEDSAKITVKLGNFATGETIYTIERKFTDRGGRIGDSLIVKDANGAQVPKVSTFLESLIGSGAAIDPTEIMLQRPGEKIETFAKRQAETLMERLGLTEVLDRLDREIKTVFDARTVKNSQVASLEGDVSRYETYPPNTPDAELDVAALSKAIGQCQQSINQHADATRRLAIVSQRVSDINSHIVSLKQQLDQAERELESTKSLEIEASNEESKRQDLATIAKAQAEDAQAKINSANAINANVRLKREHKAAKQRLTVAAKEAADMTAKIEALRKERIDAVASAKIPVEGLEFSPQGLIYNGIPLVQESTGNMTRVCALLATAESPQCRVMLLRDVTLLSTANRQIIHDVAKEKGWQVWEEVMAEAPPSDGLYIVAGEISAVNGKGVA